MILHAQKAQEAQKEHKAPKSTNSIKTQPNKSTKTQISKQKLKMHLKTPKGKKSLICIFVLAKKKIKKSPQWKCWSH